MFKSNFISSIIYWFVIFSLILIFSFLYQNLKEYSSINNENSTELKDKFEQHNFNNTYDFPNINVKLEPEKSILFTKDSNILVVLLIIYSIGLSLLFTYREKSRISKEMLEEKIKIEKDRIQSKVKIFENIEEELKKYENILNPEMKIDNLDKKVDLEPNYIIFNSRVVLEKILLNICKKYDLEEETLGSMIYSLYKKQILTPVTHGYSHTIKAFGNRAAHPNLKNPIVFTPKDALLVLSTLISLLSIFESEKLLEGLNDEN